MAIVSRAILRQAYDFWFGELDGPAAFPAEKAATWFKPTPEIDVHIRETYGPLFRTAAQTNWDLPSLSRQELMGLVVMLDQFPRNAFRDSANAFAHDEAARAVAKRLIFAGIGQFYFVERPFLFLPLEHSEDFADQEQCVRLFRGLNAVAPEEGRDFYVSCLDFAIRHYALVARFDRFPHRNAALGRVSTPAEEAFLKENGRGF